MIDWFCDLDWEFWIGSVVIPIALFLGGLQTGRIVERKAISKAKIKGHNNTVVQNSKFEK